MSDKLLVYKVIPPDDLHMAYITEDWEEAVKVARDWDCDTIQEWLGGRQTADLDFPPDPRELSRKLTVRMSIEQNIWLTQLEEITGMNKSQLTRLSLTLLAAFMNQPPIPAILPQGNPHQTPLPDSPLETRLHAMVGIACETTYHGTRRLLALRVIQNELKASDD